MRAISLITALLLAGLACGPQPDRDAPHAADSHAAAPPAAEAHGGEQAHTAHRFDDAERYAQSLDDPARDAWQMPARVIAALDIQAGQTVADVGAGTGYFTVRLAEQTGAATVYAVDIEPSMVDYTRDRAEAAGLDHVVAVLADTERTNLPAPVDLVLIVDTYHHIPDRVAYFERLRQDLTRLGRLAIIDVTKDSPSGPPVEFRFDPEQITGELSRAGYDLVAQHDFLPRQMFLIYR